MSTPTFAETYNLVAFLEKPSESEGFEQIIDFLNAKSIRYALTMNPTNYASCVKQFRTTAKVKKGGVKFLMFPRFLQEFLDKQVEGMAKHKEIYVISSHTKKVFANMRIQGQGFFRNVTPLFETMMVDAQEKKKIKSKRKQRQAAKDHSPSSEIPIEESIPTPSNDPLPSGEDSIQLNELIIFCTNLQQQVLDLEEEKIAQAKEIAKLKKRVKKLEKKEKSRPAGLVSRAKVIENQARSWSIPSEDPYKEAAQQLLEQAPCSREYVPDPIELEDHVSAHIPEHPNDLVPAEDEAPIEAYIPKVASTPRPSLPPSFLSLRIRPPHTRAAMAHMRAVVPSTCHSLLPSGTPPSLPIPLLVPSTSRRAEIPKADTPPRKWLLLTAPRPGCEVGESSVAAARRMMTALEMVNMRVSYQVDVRSRESLEFYSRHHDAQKDRAAVRAEIEVLRRERLAYEQESIQTREALAKSEAYSRALEARVAVLETQARRYEWQRQTADDFAIQPIMRTQALEAGAHIDTLEDNVPPVTPAPTATTTTVTEAQLQALINRGVAAAMAEAKAGRVRNGYDSNESDRVEKYIDGLPDTIHDSVKATRPKTMQEAIEFSTELMDKRIRDVVENKRKFKEKEYPLSDGVMTLMLNLRLQVEEDSEVARDLMMEIFLKANQPKSKSLDTSSN
nr:hypothetical protein [Tanacetum cinerariifolium]